MRRAVSVLLAWFALYGLVVGAWQAFAPRSFFDDFPGFGRHWVDVDGPYNEHLLRDVGQGNLGFGVVALVALVTGSVWLARATGLAATVAYLPHQLYHQQHLGVLETTSDRVLQTLTLSLVSITAVLLTVLAFRLRPAPEGTRGPAERRVPAGSAGSGPGATPR